MCVPPEAAAHSVGRRGRPSLNRGGPVFGQGYTSGCAPLLEPPNKLSKSLISYAAFYHLSVFFLNFILVFKRKQESMIKMINQTGYMKEV